MASPSEVGKLGRMVLLTMFGLALVAVACGGSDGDGESLTGDAWSLTSIRSVDGSLASPLADVVVTATFTEAELSGDAGCNRYAGGYTSDGGSIAIGPLGSTLRACTPAIDQQESQYIDLLHNASRFEIDGTELTLFGPGDEASLVFAALEPTALAGTSWNAIAVNNGNEAVVSVIVGTAITATFEEDGTISGDGGCNSYSTVYEAGVDTISIGAVAAGRRACPEPEGVEVQEQNFFTALGNADAWTINGDRLELRDADGALQISFSATSG